jgi:bacterioferritin (cytochrome b1)
MTKQEGMKELCTLAAAWYGNSKQHAVFSAYLKYNGYNTLAEKFHEESEEEWKEANEAMNRQHRHLIEKVGYDNYLLEML